MTYTGPSMACSAWITAMTSIRWLVERGSAPLAKGPSGQADQVGRLAVDVGDVPVVVLQAIADLTRRHHTHRVALLERALDVGGDGPAHVAHGVDLDPVDHEELHPGIGELAPGFCHGHRARPGDVADLAPCDVAPAQGGGV